MHAPGGFALTIQDLYIDHGQGGVHEGARVRPTVCSVGRLYRDPTVSPFRGGTGGGGTEEGVENKWKVIH